jgi:hypothetical protein
LDRKLIASLEVDAGGIMTVLQLLLTVLLAGLNQMFESHYGPLGVLCLFLLGVGFRDRDPTCLSAGAVFFVLLMLQA